ncbi:hypothetical protein ECG_04504 [Echinococcus granulosus]|uniref:Expressed conserved protein n=1 Tax=Echinococcus granulosus TaxID=6210 RepID=U6J422_ECHGR|nr:hypothetical protein EGR_00958 [Echinococcus granulosus]EUB64414.1 hypothetical protein EGR_00958 [Echinococcus granulosus]KAH9282366.1 hypothetical protein ECG_04504 [Echinococcus granulosus]CDS17212.1 expressed conserved protein [Echinococcus granulosus]
MHLLGAKFSFLCLYAAALAISLDEGMYPEMEIPGGYFIGEMDPFQQDFEEGEDMDDQNGWMEVNEGDITQLLDRIEEAERKEDENGVERDDQSSQQTAEEYEDVATEKLAVKTVDEVKDAEETMHAPATTTTMPPSKSTNFWTTDLVVEKAAENEAAKEAMATISTAGVIASATAAAMGEGAKAILSQVETTLSSVDDLDVMTSESQ